MKRAPRRVEKLWGYESISANSKKCVGKLPQSIYRLSGEMHLDDFVRLDDGYGRVHADG